MTKIQNLTLITFFTAALISCGGASELEEKKAQLEEYKKQLAETRTKITQLEKELAELDEDFTDQASSVLVAAFPIKKQPFVHKVKMRGSVESRKNVMLSAETMGRIESILVSEGQDVRKGQLLIKLDANVLENNVAEVQTQLELAQAVYNRQANLWEQNIGTEIQYLESKNSKESLERRLETLKSQLNQAKVVAPFSGIVDNIPVKVGEMAQPGLPLIRIVNQREMYIQADVSERYIGKFHQGDSVEVYFPSQDIRLTSRISSVGKVLKEQNRTFNVEVAIPVDAEMEFRPNQIAELTLTDYLNRQAVSVPTKVIQSDDQGEYVFILTEQDGKQVAKKVAVTTGKSYNSFTEILTGLNGNERLISEGYRDVSEGTVVSLSTASL